MLLVVNSFVEIRTGQGWLSCFFEGEACVELVARDVPRDDSNVLLVMLIVVGAGG